MYKIILPSSYNVLCMTWIEKFGYDLRVSVIEGAGNLVQVK